MSANIFNQKYIDAKQRKVVIARIIKAHESMELFESILWLCVNIIDRYLERFQVDQSSLQLVAVTALLIASKFDEISPPKVLTAYDCAILTDNTFTRDNVVEMELQICGELILDYRIPVPTVYHVLNKYLSSLRVSEQVKYLCGYYAEISLHDLNVSLGYKPQMFAASALFGALCCAPSSLERVWTPYHVELTGYTMLDLYECASLMLELARWSCSGILMSAWEKYSTPQKKCVSLLPITKDAISSKVFWNFSEPSFRQALQIFYGENAPQMLKKIPSIIEKYTGTEEKLVEIIEKKYGSKFPGYAVSKASPEVSTNTGFSFGPASVGTNTTNADTNSSVPAVGKASPGVSANTGMPRAVMSTTADFSPSDGPPDKNTAPISASMTSANILARQFTGTGFFAPLNSFGSTAANPFAQGAAGSTFGSFGANQVSNPFNVVTSITATLPSFGPAPQTASQAPGSTFMGQPRKTLTAKRPAPKK